MIKEETKFKCSDIFEGMSSISALIKAIELQKNDRRILRVLIDQNRIKQKQAEFRFLKLKSTQLGFVIEITDTETIKEKTVGSTHGGIIAECTERTIPILQENHIQENGVYFILEGVEDPYNFGYAVRALYAAGVTGLILGERNWMGVSGVVARSSAGASELMDMYVSNPIDAISMMKAKNYTVLCAGIRDSESLFDTDLNKPLLIILGGEKRGISRNVLNLADRVVRIDYGTNFGGSLSTSAAAAVFAFEILRYNQ